MVKRGVSADEKKERLLKIFHDSLEPFTLKAIEKAGAKAGVSAMTIKGVLEELVADNLVELDKIGATNFYWSFPSKNVIKMESDITSLKSRIDQLQKSEKTLEMERDELTKTRKPSEERTRLLKQHEALLQEISTLEATLQTHAADIQAGNDSMMLQQKVDIAKSAANRWTDNTWQLLDHLRKTYFQPKKDIMNMLQMKEDFDYPEYAPPKKKAKKA